MSEEYDVHDLPHLATYSVPIAGSENAIFIKECLYGQHFEVWFTDGIEETVVGCYEADPGRNVGVPITQCAVMIGQIVEILNGVRPLTEVRVSIHR